MTGKQLLDMYHSFVDSNAEYGVITNDQAMRGGILLVGMNPSGSGNGIYDFTIPGNPNDRCEKDFWIPKRKMLGKYLNKCGYIDLLPIREGSQKIATDQKHIDERGKLLSTTRNYIEWLNPKLIIFANSAQYYWGFNKKKEWMGYQFINIASPLPPPKNHWKLYEITGIHANELNMQAISTSLQGSYFLQYRQHKARGKVVGPELELTFEDIQTIAKAIDSEWEKNLY